MEAAMNLASSGIIGGLAGGLAIGLAMSLGRQSKLLQKTLAEDSEDWIDRIADSRRRVGKTGTTIIEQTNHLMASAAFGCGYGLLRGALPSVPRVPLGLGYGAALYAVNIAGIAPLLGITEGEHNASGRQRTERLGVHLLFGLMTASIADAFHELG
jgi:hypothetical protein